MTSHFAAISVLMTMVYFTQLLVFRLLLRSNRAAIAVTTLVFGALNALISGGPEPSGLVVIQAFVFAILFSVAALRFGLLAALTTAFVQFAFLTLPWTLDISAWYAARAIPGLMVLVLLVSYGFFTSLGGQSLFRDPLE